MQRTYLGHCQINALKTNVSPQNEIDDQCLLWVCLSQQGMMGRLDFFLLMGLCHLLRCEILTHNVRFPESESGDNES